MAGNASGIRAGRAYVELFAEDSKLLAGLKAAEARMQSFGSGVRSVGQSMVMTGAAIAMPMVAASKVFADFESAMARVKALTGSTDDEFSALSALAKKLGADTIFSAAQAAQAMGNFAQAGLSVKEIMDAVGPTLDLAATAQIDIAQAADISTKIMRGMGIAASDLSGVVDVLAKASTTANTDIAMLGDAFKFVGPIAKSSGVSLEEVTASIQLLSNAGIQGEMAGTTLRGMILSLLAPSKEAADMLQSLGIHTLDAQGRFVGLSNILAQFEKAMAGMGSGQKIGVLGNIFSDRQAAGVAELMAQGASKLAEATSKLGSSTGTAAKVAGIQMNTLRGTIDILMSSIEVVGIEIGQVLSPIIRVVGAILADAANSVADFVRNNKEFTIIAAGLAAGLIAAGGAMISLGVASSIVGSALGFISAGMGLVSGAAGAVGAAFAAMASPIGIIAAALVAGGIAVVIYSGAGRAALQWLADGFISLRAIADETFKGIADAMQAGDIKLAASILWAGLKVAWLTGTNYLKGVWSDWGLAVKQVVADLQTSIAGIFLDILSAVQIIWYDLTSSLTGTWGDMIGDFVKSLVPFKDALKAFGVDVSTAIDDSLKTLGFAVTTPEQRQTQRDKAVGDIGQQNIDAHQALSSSADAETKARRKAAQDALDKSGADLEKAKADLTALTGQADNLRRVKEASKPSATAKPGEAPPLDTAGLDAALTDAKAKIDVSGSFNAAAFKGLGLGESVANEQLKEQQKSTNELQTLNRKVDKAKWVLTD